MYVSLVLWRTIQSRGRGWLRENDAVVEDATEDCRKIKYGEIEGKRKVKDALIKRQR